MKKILKYKILVGLVPRNFPPLPGLCKENFSGVGGAKKILKYKILKYKNFSRVVKIFLVKKS